MLNNLFGKPVADPPLMCAVNALAGAGPPLRCSGELQVSATVGAEGLGPILGTGPTPAGIKLVKVGLVGGRDIPFPTTGVDVPLSG